MKESLAEIQNPQGAMTKTEKASIASVQKLESKLNTAIQASVAKMSNLKKKIDPVIKAQRTILHKEVLGTTSSASAHKAAKEAAAATLKIQQYLDFPQRWVPIDKFKRVEKFLKNTGGDRTDTIGVMIYYRLRDVSGLSKLLVAEVKWAQKFDTHQKYATTLQGFNTEVKTLEASLRDIENTIEGPYRDATISAFKNKADKLSMSLKVAISASKCNSMQTTSNAKASIIKKCQLAHLGKNIKKSITTTACKALNANTSSKKIAACITAYRKENNLKG